MFFYHLRDCCGEYRLGCRSAMNCDDDLNCDDELDCDSVMG